MNKLALGLVVACMTFAPAQGHAQNLFGPLAAYHLDLDFGVGVMGLIPLPSVHENFSISPSFVYFFPGDGGFSGAGLSYFEINADAVLKFPIEGSITPFALGGINIGRFSFDEDVTGFDFAFSGTEVGLNLGGGVTFETSGSLVPFAGGKIELNGGDGLVLFGGVGFPVGGGS